MSPFQNAQNTPSHKRHNQFPQNNPRNTHENTNRGSNAFLIIGPLLHTLDLIQTIEQVVIETLGPLTIQWLMR